MIPGYTVRYIKGQVARAEEYRFEKRIYKSTRRIQALRLLPVHSMIRSFCRDTCVLVKPEGEVEVLQALSCRSFEQVIQTALQ